MPNEIRRYPVQHPLLRKYIKFFWELRIESMQLNHKIVPQRNINLRINLSETPQFVCLDGKERRLEEVYFSGLQDHFCHAHIKLSGKVDVLGVCFLPDGFFPFVQIPVSEFKNQVLGAREIGLQLSNTIAEQLKEAPDVATRLAILEHELVLMLLNGRQVPENFRQIFTVLKQSENPGRIAEFCRRNNIGLRQLERMYLKHIGVSANTFSTLNRFHATLNQLLIQDYTKFSDLAFDNGYFDQMHFIKNFKRFAGDTPKGFAQQKNSILQIGKLT